MAVNQAIFDPTTQNTKYILIDVEATLIQEDEDGNLDLYITLSTTAKKKNGSSIPKETIRNLNDMVIGGEGGVKRKDGSPGPYSSLTDAITDYILYMVEGDGVDPQTAMDFTT